MIPLRFEVGYGRKTFSCIQILCNVAIALAAFFDLSRLGWLQKECRTSTASVLCQRGFVTVQELHQHGEKYLTLSNLERDKE